MPNATDVLSPAQLAELESVLKAERARLERYLPQEATSHADPVTGLARGEIPLGDSADEFAPTPRQADARLYAVVEALGRIRDGRYGRCARCDGAIPFGRLIVLPESDHCVGCGPM